MIIVTTERGLENFARRFFPHLLPVYGRLAAVVMLRAIHKKLSEGQR